MKGIIFSGPMVRAIWKRRKQFVKIIDELFPD